VYPPMSFGWPEKLANNSMAELIPTSARTRDLRVLRAAEPSFDLIDVVPRRLLRADQHEVVPPAVLRVGQNEPVRERLEERRDLALHGGGVAS